VESIVVLASGGLDSCALLAHLAESNIVHPVYVRQGQAWEPEEQRALESFIEALGSSNVRSVTVLSAPVAPIYGEHWSLTGRGVPSAGEHPATLWMPGRNILLIAPTAVWCAVHGISRIAMACLDENPFDDATPDFFAKFGAALSQGLERQVSIVAPFSGWRKQDVIRRYAHLPLHLSLTCMAPRGGAHCGACKKCEERRDAFKAAGVADKTRYQAQRPMGV
jgi:7-cyano-7-deazaguanine synthase